MSKHEQKLAAFGEALMAVSLKLAAVGIVWMIPTMVLPFATGNHTWFVVTFAPFIAMAACMVVELVLMTYVLVRYGVDGFD